MKVKGSYFTNKFTTNYSLLMKEATSPTSSFSAIHLIKGAISLTSLKRWYFCQAADNFIEYYDYMTINLTSPWILYDFKI